jgi:hypothetical protein
MPDSILMFLVAAIFGAALLILAAGIVFWMASPWLDGWMQGRTRESIARMDEILARIDANNLEMAQTGRAELVVPMKFPFRNWKT